MSLIRSEALFALLRKQQHIPYAHFPDRRQPALRDVLRVFDLHPQDRLSLAAPGHALFVSVLAGIVETENADSAPITVRRGETRLIAPHGDTLSLSSTGGAHICVADSESIDELMSFEMLLDGASANHRISLEALERARRSPAFRRVPLECVDEALRRMGHMSAAPGTEVIRQGDHGDLFYVLTQGKAEVWQTGLYDEAPRQVAELGPGDVFGEEALVTGGTRSATVRIIDTSEMLTLDKAAYQALISRQMVDEVESSIARTMLNAGFRPLDVRYAEEHEDSCIPNSVLMPLSDLRSRAGELDRSGRWIVYCRSGKRSAVATLLLKQRGFHAVSLKGGINDWPYATVSEAG